MTKKWIPRSGDLAIYKANGDHFFNSEIVQICKWYTSKTMIDFAKICKYRAKNKKESVIVRKSYLKEYRKENN